VRTIRYQQIAENLRERLVAGNFVAGRMLPSESELSAEFSASRVTVRRALEVLRDEGLVNARQGFGWFVPGDTVRQPLGKLATIEEQMRASGVTSQRRIVEFSFESAPKKIADVLGTTQVLRVLRVNLADGEPFAIVTVWCSAEVGQHLSRRDVEQSPFYELLDVPLSGATQTIGDDAATPDDATMLHIPVGSPVLRCERVTSDTTGRPVLVSHHVFPAHRTNFVVELPSVPASISPTGLRLVD
jgi:GntR family transcriptional regulator